MQHVVFFKIKKNDTRKRHSKESRSAIRSREIDYGEAEEMPSIADQAMPYRRLECCYLRTHLLIL